MVCLEWLELTLRAPGQDIQALALALTAAGFSELVIEDAAELTEFLDENRDCWDYIDEKLQRQLDGLAQIRLYLPDTDTDALTRLEAFAAERSLTLERKRLAQTNWDEDWKGSYPPLRVGKKLLVLPYWLRDEAAPDDIPVILDPGLTFGTGAHPSTQLVMERLEELLSSGARCLDLGSGSGILSITALALGASEAVGVDIDPKAETAARENAAYNGTAAERFTALTGNVLTDAALMDSLAAQKWDFVLVNIVADVIIGLCPVLLRLLHGGTRLILSGILDTRLPDVLAALQKAGLTGAKVYAREEWRCVTV